MMRLRATTGGPLGKTGSRPATIELVVAAADNNVIGRNNRLPWRLPADLQRFKALTLGKSVLMGRKTYESIGKALPGRINMILTRASDFRADNCMTVSSLDEAREHAASRSGSGSALMIIGGADVYRQSMPMVTRIHLTLVHTHVEDGDAFFDGWRTDDWVETGRERHGADERHRHAFSFVTLDRERPRSVAAPAR